MILRNSLTLIASFAGLFVSLSLVTAGCSQNGGNGDGDNEPQTTNPEYTFCGSLGSCPPDVTGVDLTTPVSFRNEINPILFQACSGGSACHQSTTSSGVAFSMGNPKMALDEASQQALVTYLTTANSQVATTTRLVIPGDWQNSFMMMKIDGCQNFLGLACTMTPAIAGNVVCTPETDVTSCGDGMPQSEGTATSPTPYPLLPDDMRKFRAWIAQGAQFN